MKRTMGLLSFGVFVAITTISAHAACGGGGFKASVDTNSHRSTTDSASVTTTTSTPVPASSVSASVSTPVVSTNASVNAPAMSARKSEKLEDRQRDIDKAQARLDNCTGDCEKERRKLSDAKAKYDREMSQNY